MTEARSLAAARPPAPALAAGEQAGRGWLLDVYAAGGQVVLWLLEEAGARRRLHQPFPVTFYAAGPAPSLRALWRFLESEPFPARLARAERRDLFSGPVSVLAAEADSPGEAERLFAAASSAFPHLTYYNADIPLALRFAAAHGVFPLAWCEWSAGPDGRLHQLRPLDSPWELDPPPAPLRTLFMEPDCDPAHADPQEVHLRCGRCSYRLPLAPTRPLLVNLRAILNRHDPDLLLTAWGDTWLLPRLLEMAEQTGLPLPLNRDEGMQVAHRPEHSYFSYGQVVHRGRQVHLFGRLHVDRCNAMLWSDYEMEGVLEIARVTALPVQTAARVSPGTGISAMQMLTALRQDILVPWHKQQSEQPKSALDLFYADQGGLVYQPTIGLHHNVAGIDFVSMYPGIMVRFNISPETVGPRRPDSFNLQEVPSPQAGGVAPPGLVPLTLAPLLGKRLALKTRLVRLPAWHPQRALDKARSSAHKWLLVTCFGYLGYKNARFGRIEAHEAVTAYGREALLRAKEAAEDMGFTVLHLYVDGLWVQKPGAASPADFQALLDAIRERTGLPIALDGIYRWIAFLPSRVDRRVPVPNRYFGLFQDGSLKLRGIEARRRDTPPWIVETQVALLERLARLDTASPAGLQAAQAEILRLLRRRLADLRAGRVPVKGLLVRQKLSREVSEYRSPSPAARAAAQLEQAGKGLRPGQSVRFIYTRGEPGVRAWDLPGAPNLDSLNTARYAELLLRAAASVLEPFGLDEARLRAWLSLPAHGGHQPYYPRLPGTV